MSENPQAVSFPIEPPERKPVEVLGRLAERYWSERFIIDGVDDEARENNQLAVEAVQAAGERLGTRFNEFFGISIGGSRIKGYNTKDSDIDIVVVTPDTTGDSGFVYKAIEEELAARGIMSGIDTMMGMWTKFDIETDPEKFVYRVDHHGDELITLFGYTPYRNANMDLSRLAALEVIQGYPAGYDWASVAKEFARTYLGQHKHIVEKLALKYGVSEEEVGKIFTRDLFRERHRKFGLKDPKPMYDELKKWYLENHRKLGSFRMFDVYNGVLKRLNEGF